jgi:dihydrodipicolinate reductase
MDRIRVGVNGYGVIGKRVADAVHAQPDMHLVGVADIVTDWRIQSAVPRLPVFAATPTRTAAWWTPASAPREPSTISSRRAT